MPPIRIFVATLFGIPLAALLACTGAGPARAESESADDDQPAETSASDHRGPGAGLEFLITNDFTLSSFSGALISYRTQSANGRGWRFGADLDGAYRKLEDVSSTPDTSIVAKSAFKLVTVDFIVQRMFTHPARRDLGFYWGVGPDAGIELRRETSPGGGDWRRINVWHAGVIASAGVEWLLRDRLSVLAEYGASARYAHSSVKNGSVFGTNISRSNDFTFSPQQVRFGLATWFR